MQYLFLLALGLALGSFANVYFYRLPKELSLFSPSSFCPNCNHPIPWYENIPLFSYLLLSGRCSSCRQAISLRYPLVEILSGFLFLFISIYFDSEKTVSLAAILFFSFLLFLAAGIDLITYFDSGKEYGIIPDHLVFILAISGLLFAPLNPLLKSPFEFPFFERWFAFHSLLPSSSLTQASEKGFWAGLFLSLFGSGTGFAFLYLTRQIASFFFGKEALGLGDVKLVWAIGFWIGWQGVFLTLILGSLIGTILSLFLILTKKMERKASIPFAPFLSFGAYLSLFLL